MKRSPRDDEFATTPEDTFIATAYRLDGKRLLDLALKVTVQASAIPTSPRTTTPAGRQIGTDMAERAGRHDTQATTVAGALYYLAPPSQNETSSIQDLLGRAINAIVTTDESLWHANNGEFMVGTAYSTADGETVLTGPKFHREALTMLLDLAREGIDPFETVWFWYESEPRSVGEQEWVAHSFFVVDGDRIVRDCVTFTDDRDSAMERNQREFTPSIFVDADAYLTASDDPRGIDTILSDNAWRIAQNRFWYRRFYQETRTGQLMVLRPDRPELHHFPEGHWQPAEAFAVIERRLAQTTTALWVLAILVGLGLLTLWV